MKAVSVHTHVIEGKVQYSIHYIINKADPKLISKLDSMIYKAQCDYYGIPSNIDTDFFFNIAMSVDCDVVMFNLPYDVVYRIAQKLADALGVIININDYRYM